MYCPCQGRLANQLDYLIGALYWAKSINRSLIIPPFINYRWLDDEHPITLIKFAEYFDLTKLSQFHRIISMDYSTFKNNCYMNWKW